MERFITDERTGLKYELVGDYYLIAGEDEQEEYQPIGIWGQRHLRYLKKHRRVRYATLLEMCIRASCLPWKRRSKTSVQTLKPCRTALSFTASPRLRAAKPRA